MKQDVEKSPVVKLPGARVLLVVSPYYKGVTDLMLEGAEAVAAEAEIMLDRVLVPGAFELPGAIKLARKHYMTPSLRSAASCGETSHYDYVCGESARGSHAAFAQGCIGWLAF